MPTYQGLVATGGLIPFWQSASTQMGSRKRHTATVALSTFKLLFPNFTGFDTPTGAALNLTASVEYPVGVFTQVKFSGLAQGVVPNGGVLMSDDVSVAIPAGANFYIRTYGTNTAGVIAARQTNPQDYDFGEARESGASGITDKTMGGTYTNSFPGYCYSAMAIIGTTNKPSVLVLGSSTAGGFNNQGGLPYGPDNGTITPSLAPTIANTLLSAYNQTAATANAASNLIPNAIGQYITHVVCAMGQNDIRSGDSAITVRATIAAFRAKYASGKQFFVQTFGPETSSTDSWATTVNQTPAASNAERIAFNGLVRSGSVASNGYFEIADAWETARNSGLWKVPAWTDDGLHAQAVGYQFIKDNNLVSPALFVLPDDGLTVTSVPDFRWSGPPQVFIPVFPGKPTDGTGRNGNLCIDTAGRRIYEKVAGAWNNGTAF
jgi:hypothetical protein